MALSAARFYCNDGLFRNQPGKAAKNAMKKPAKKRLAFAAALIFGCLVLIEASSFALLTILDVKSGLSLEKALAIRRAELSWAWGRKVFLSIYDPITQIRHKPGSHYFGLLVNENGFIGNGNNGEAPSGWPEKPGGVIRVALLGGSSTAGYGVRDNAQTIAAILEDRLNLVYGSPGRRFEVLNLGVAGGYSAMELSIFMNTAVYLSPDAVVFLDGYNDAFNAVCEYRRNKLPHPLVNWFDYSYATFEAMNGFPEKAWPRVKFLTWFSVAAGRLALAVIPRNTLPLYESYPHYRLSGKIAAKNPFLENVTANNLEAVAAYCAVNRIPALFYLQPQPLSGQKKLTEEEKSGISDWNLRFSAKAPYIDTEKLATDMNAAFLALENRYEKSAEKFRPWPYVRFISLSGLFADEPETVYVDNLHTNERGNRAIAERYLADLSVVLGLK